MARSEPSVEFIQLTPLRLSGFLYAWKTRELSKGHSRNFVSNSFN
jgi:hypothetical protein